MMLVSVLGTVLAASAAVVPVGAVPCTKGKSSSAPSQAPSAVSSGPEAQAPSLPPAVAVASPQAPTPDKKVPAVSSAGVDGQATSSPRPKCTKRPEGVGNARNAPAAGPSDGPKQPVPEPQAAATGGVDSDRSGQPGALPCTKCANKTGSSGAGPETEIAPASDPKKPAPGPPAQGRQQGSPAPTIAAGAAGQPDASKTCSKGPVESAGAGTEPDSNEASIPGGNNSPAPDGDKSGSSATTPCTKCAANTAGAQPGSDGAKASGPARPGPNSSPSFKPTCIKKPASGTPQAPKPAAETSDPQKPKPDEVKVASNPADQAVSDNKNHLGKNGDDTEPKSASRPSPSTKADPPQPIPSNTASLPEKAGDGGSSAKPDDPALSASSKPTNGKNGSLGSEIADTPGSVSVTPHEQYSSSVGVLGCKIDTNSVAYWPGAVVCNDICIKLMSDKTGKSRHLLRINSSTGARDISYQAWNELTGMSAGGGEPMTWEWADMSACSHLLHNGKMPDVAFNGIGYPNACMAKAKEEGSSPNWLSQNYQLFNYAEARCENCPGNECSFDSTTQQVDCGSTSAATGGKGPGVKDVPYDSL